MALYSWVMTWEISEAINKRAQFLPHIDSGAGAGQNTLGLMFL